MIPGFFVVVVVSTQIWWTDLFYPESAYLISSGRPRCRKFMDGSYEQISGKPLRFIGIFFWSSPKSVSFFFALRNPYLHKQSEDWFTYQIFRWQGSGLGSVVIRQRSGLRQFSLHTLIKFLFIWAYFFFLFFHMKKKQFHCMYVCRRKASVLEVYPPHKNNS